jgi:hypothetical protein
MVLSPLKIEGHCLKALLEVMTMEPRSYRWLMTWKSRSGSALIDGQVAQFV